MMTILKYISDIRVVWCLCGVWVPDIYHVYQYI